MKTTRVFYYQRILNFIEKGKITLGKPMDELDLAKLNIPQNALRYGEKWKKLGIKVKRNYNGTITFWNSEEYKRSRICST